MAKRKPAFSLNVHTCPDCSRQKENGLDRRDASGKTTMTNVRWTTWQNLRRQMNEAEWSDRRRLGLIFDDVCHWNPFSIFVYYLRNNRHHRWFLRNRDASHWRRTGATFYSEQQKGDRSIEESLECYLDEDFSSKIVRRWKRAILVRERIEFVPNRIQREFVTEDFDQQLSQTFLLTDATLDFNA